MNVTISKYKIKQCSDIGLSCRSLLYQLLHIVIFYNFDTK